MKPKPRILALLGAALLFGQERGNIAALTALRDKGCSVLCLVREEKWAKAIPEYLDKLGLPWRRAPFLQNRVPDVFYSFYFQNFRRYFSSNSFFKKTLRDFTATHIHVMNPYFFLSFYRSIMDLQGCAVIYRAGDKPLTHNAFWRWLWRRIVDRVDHFVANSEFIARELVAHGVQRERITIIYNAPPPRDRGPEPGREPDHAQHFLFIGQLTPDKGIDRLIEAFRRVVPKYPEARLTVIGRIADWRVDDWIRALRDRTRLDPQMAKRVVFVGETEDIYAHLASAAVLVVPSVWEEPSANVVTEGKAAARPSIVFPRGGLPELIDHGGDGYICRDTSVEALVEGLCYYLDDPKRMLAHGPAALASMSRLGIDRFADAWLDVYERTMPGRGDLIELSKKAR